MRALFYPATVHDVTGFFTLHYSVVGDAKVLQGKDTDNTINTLNSFNFFSLPLTYFKTSNAIITFCRSFTTSTSD